MLRCAVILAIASSVVWADDASRWDLAQSLEWQVADLEAAYGSDAVMSGTVVLSVVVGEDRKQGEIAVTEPLEKSLDREAIQAVGKWRFAPAQRDGRKVGAGRDRGNFRAL